MPTKQKQPEKTTEKSTLLDVIIKLDAEVKAKTHNDGITYKLMRSYNPVLSRLVTLANNADDYQNDSMFQLLREANGYHSYYDANGNLRIGVEPDFKLLQSVANKILKDVFELDYEVELDSQRLTEKFEVYESYILRSNN